MPYTVRVCRDAVGWFGTFQTPPREIVHFEVEVEDGTLAHQLLDAAQDLARRLDR